MTGIPECSCGTHEFGGSMIPTPQQLGIEKAELVISQMPKISAAQADPQ